MSGEQRTTIPFRERAKEASGALIEVASPLLKDVVDYADDIFWRCLEVAESPDLEDHAPLVLYRHITEMADGIQVLISEGCSGPAIPLLRSCFEPWLSLTYILEPGKKYEERSLAWLCSYLHGEIEQMEMLDRNTAKGMGLAKSLRKEAPEALQKMRPLQQVAVLQGLLAQPHFAKIEAKYQQLKRNGEQRPYWSSLARGPKSTRRLANSLSRGAPYQLFYGAWSALIHGSDASRFFANLPDGDVAFKPLRDPAGLKKSACLAQWFINQATKSMIRRFIPQEALNFLQWESGIIQRVERLERFVLSALP